MVTSVTSRELATVLPNGHGGRGVHPRTVERRVKRGELPAYDFKFHDARGWAGDTLEHPHLAPFVAALEQQVAA